VGRPGLDPGTLGPTLEQLRLSLNTQSCKPKEVSCSPALAELHLSLISWLDDWPYKSSYADLANVRFESSGGKNLEVKFGINWKSLEPLAEIP
jgi:hypothetical protein